MALSETLPAPSEALLALSEALPALLKVLPDSKEALPALSNPILLRPSMLPLRPPLYLIGNGHHPLWGCQVCPSVNPSVSFLSKTRKIVISTEELRFSNYAIISRGRIVGLMSVV